MRSSISSFKIGNTLSGHIIRGLDESDLRKLYFRNVFPDCARLTRFVMNMDLAVGAYGELKEYFHLREEEIWTRLGYIDIQNLAPRIRAKVMMQTGLMDTTCQPSTQFAACNKIPSEKEVLFYPDFGHEGLKGGDDKIFRFLLNL